MDLPRSARHRSTPCLAGKGLLRSLKPQDFGAPIRVGRQDQARTHDARWNAHIICAGLHRSGANRSPVVIGPTLGASGRVGGLCLGAIGFAGPGPRPGAGVADFLAPLQAAGRGGARVSDRAD